MMYYPFAITSSFDKRENKSNNNSISASQKEKMVTMFLYYRFVTLYLAIAIPNIYIKRDHLTRNKLQNVLTIDFFLLDIAARFIV